MFDELFEMNVHIENAIRNSKEGMDQDHLMSIIRAVQKCIKAQSHVYVPISNPDANYGENYMFRTTYSPEHHLYAVAFTNDSEANRNNETAVLLYDMKTILKVVQSTADLHGLVFNPWGDAFYMPKTVIQLILDHMQDCEEPHVRDNMLLDQAIHLATEKYAGQLLPGSTKPYILHALKTMDILASMNAETYLLASGILYHIFDRTELTLNDIVTTFGSDIISMITNHFEPEDSNFRVRKTLWLANVRKGSTHYKMLVLAECVSSLTDILLTHPDQRSIYWKDGSYTKEDLAWLYEKTIENLQEMGEYRETAPVYNQLKLLYQNLF